MFNWNARHTTPKGWRWAGVKSEWLIRIETNHTTLITLCTGTFCLDYILVPNIWYNSACKKSINRPFCDTWRPSAPPGKLAHGGVCDWFETIHTDPCDPVSQCEAGKKQQRVNFRNLVWGSLGVLCGHWISPYKNHLSWTSAEPAGSFAKFGRGARY